MNGHRISSLQARANAKRTTLEKIADWFTSRLGRMSFLIANLIWFVVWITINTNHIPGIAAFDPYPFGMLTTIVSLEAIMLSIIVLMSQNRAAYIEEIREEIDLQMDVITEKEITKLLEIVTHLAKKQGLDLSQDATIKEMLKPIDMNKLQRVLEKQLH